MRGFEYQRKDHSEIRESPLTRYMRGPTVGRESPNSDTLRRAFRTDISRKQRRSDGTVTVEGIRFEVPTAYRTLLQLRLRVARWDLSSVGLVDPRSGEHLVMLLPLDKARNAERIRRVIVPAAECGPSEPVGIAPHLRALMTVFAVHKLLALTATNAAGPWPTSTVPSERASRAARRWRSTRRACATAFTPCTRATSTASDQISSGSGMPGPPSSVRQREIRSRTRSNVKAPCPRPPISHLASVGEATGCRREPHARLPQAHGSPRPVAIPSYSARGNSQRDVACD